MDDELVSRIDEIEGYDKTDKISHMTRRDYIVAAVITLLSLLGIIGGLFL